MKDIFFMDKISFNLHEIYKKLSASSSEPLKPRNTTDFFTTYTYLNQGLGTGSFYGYRIPVT